MDENMKAPKIRFAGFADDWEQRKVSELATELVAGGDINQDLIKTNGNYPVIANALTNDGIMGYYDKDFRIKAPAVTITGRGDVGHAKARKIDFTPVVRLITFKSNQDVDFIENAINRLNIIVESTGVPQLTVPQLGKYELYFPKSNEEEKAIGELFLKLDNFITLYQRKYDKLVVMKKSMLEKMFPKDGSNVPEIRFAGFTDAWEQCKVGDVLTEKKNSIVLEDNKTYELVTVKRRNEGVVSRGLLKGKDILVKNYFEINAGDFIISKRQVIHGANGIVPQSLDKAIVSNEYLVAVGNEMISTEFWTLISKLQSMYKKFFLSSYGVDIEKLFFDVEDWKKRIIVIPVIDEQKKITKFFNNIDNLINLYQRKLEKLKEIKKSMVEKMFV